MSILNDLMRLAQDTPDEGKKGLLRLIMHPDELLKVVGDAGGYPALMGIIFAETGLLVGFFLPGDSLLVTAGYMVAQGFINPFGLAPLLNVVVLAAALCVMAIVGDAVGFFIGAKSGPALFKREKSFFFRKDHLIATHNFYEKHGGKTIILARFMPFARTFAPVVAGIGKMPYARFAMFNVAGGIGWVVSMLALGYGLGNVVSAKNLEYIVYLVVFLSVAPLLVKWLVGVMKKRSAAKAGIVAPAVASSSDDHHPPPAA